MYGYSINKILVAKITLVILLIGTDSMRILLKSLKREAREGV